MPVPRIQMSDVDFATGSRNSETAETHKWADPDFEMPAGHRFPLLPPSLPPSPSLSFSLPPSLPPPFSLFLSLSLSLPLFLPFFRWFRLPGSLHPFNEPFYARAERSPINSALRGACRRVDRRRNVLRRVNINKHDDMSEMPRYVRM